MPISPSAKNINTMLFTAPSQLPHTKKNDFATVPGNSQSLYITTQITHSGDEDLYIHTALKFTIVTTHDLN
jgi:hypothetical protein